jgi:hypothetical protein
LKHLIDEGGDAVEESHEEGKGYHDHVEFRGREKVFEGW